MKNKHLSDLNQHGTAVAMRRLRGGLMAQVTSLRFAIASGGFAAAGFALLLAVFLPGIASIQGAQ